MKATFTGKEGKSTIDFNCCVDHNCRFLYVGDLFAGRFNDKTKVLYDSYVRQLREGRFKDVSYMIKDSNDNEYQESGPYVLNDNGYQYWCQTMCPAKITALPKLAMYSKHLESTHKDQERTFGQVKRRFRVLKHSLLLEDVRHCEDLVVTCFTLHNMLLDFDKQFADNMAPTVVIPNPSDATARSVEDLRARLQYNQQQLLRASAVDRMVDQLTNVVVVQEQTQTEVDTAFEGKRLRLAQHLYYMFRNRELEW